MKKILKLFLTPLFIAILLPCFTLTSIAFAEDVAMAESAYFEQTEIDEYGLPSYIHGIFTATSNPWIVKVENDELSEDTIINGMLKPDSYDAYLNSVESIGGVKGALSLPQENDALSASWQSSDTGSFVAELSSHDFFDNKAYYSITVNADSKNELYGTLILDWNYTGNLKIQQQPFYGASYYDEQATINEGIALDGAIYELYDYADTKIAEGEVIDGYVNFTNVFYDENYTAGDEDNYITLPKIIDSTTLRLFAGYYHLKQIQAPMGHLNAEVNESGYSYSFTLEPNGATTIANPFNLVDGVSLCEINYVLVADSAKYGEGTKVPELDRVAQGYGYVAISPTLESGFSFSGWFTDENLSARYIDETPIYEDITLYGKLIDTNITNPFNPPDTDYVNVRYVLTNNSSAPDSTCEIPTSALIKRGTSYSAIKTIVGKDYSFDGWYTNYSLSNKFLDGSIITTGLTLYGKLTKNCEITPTKEYVNVTYKLIAASVAPDVSCIIPTNERVEKGQTHKAIEPIIGENYVFNGWYKKANLSDKYIGDVLEDNLTLYAKLSAQKTGDTGGSGADSGSNDDETSGDIGAGEIDSEFEEDPAPPPKLTVDSTIKLWISFSSLGGTLSNNKITKQVAYGKRIGTLPEPKRNGYKFLGWFSNISGGKKILASNKVQTSTVYYAHWVKAKFKLIYKPIWGDKLLPKKVAFESTVGKLAKPKRSGYKFIGWYTEKSKGKKINSSYAMPANNLIVYAHWKKG